MWTGSNKYKTIFWKLHKIFTEQVFKIFTGEGKMGRLLSQLLHSRWRDHSTKFDPIFERFLEVFLMRKHLQHLPNTHVRPSVSWFVTLLNFHSVSVSGRPT